MPSLIYFVSFVHYFNGCKCLITLIIMFSSIWGNFQHSINRVQTVELERTDTLLTNISRSIFLSNFIFEEQRPIWSFFRYIHRLLMSEKIHTDHSFSQWKNAIFGAKLGLYGCFNLCCCSFVWFQALDSSVSTVVHTRCQICKVHVYYRTLPQSMQVMRFLYVCFFFGSTTHHFCRKRGDR